MKANVIARIRMLGMFSIAACGISMVAPSVASAQFSVGISIGVAPPPMPLYAQPILPGPDYIWAPGYWAYGPDGYFWVPGTWVLAPEPGMLWTPGYWSASDAGFVWYSGYWGRRVGYYGGINYGYGYFGRDYVGGGWYGRHFRYNTAVTNVNTTIVRNVYVNRTVINNNTTVDRVSYNGGTGGVIAQPTSREVAMRRGATPMTSQQLAHERLASQDRSQLATVNHGRPARIAVARPFTPENHARFQPLRSAERATAPPNRAPTVARPAQRPVSPPQRPVARQEQRRPVPPERPPVRQPQR